MATKPAVLTLFESHLGNRVQVFGESVPGHAFASFRL
jgi:hypothetical protein